MREIIECHNCIFHFFSEESFFKEIIEFDFIEFSNDKYIYDIVCCFISKIENCIRDSNKIKCLSSFEELLHGSHHIIRLHEHLNEFRID